MLVARYAEAPSLCLRNPHLGGLGFDQSSPLQMTTHHLFSQASSEDDYPSSVFFGVPWITLVPRSQCATARCSVGLVLHVRAT
jgi:hypothetical protein